MTTRQERDDAMVDVDYSFFDMGKDWMVREKRNLESYIADPTSHIDYSPYDIVDMEVLRQRIEKLEGIISDLDTMLRFKQGVPEVTKADHDVALDRFPIFLNIRIQDWLNDRWNELFTIVINKYYIGGVYQGPIVLDMPELLNQMHVYTYSMWGLGFALQYTAEQEVPVGLLGVAPTTIGGLDGKITGVDSTMEYQAAGDTVWTAVVGTEITGLTAGDYAVRIAADAEIGKPPGQVVIITVPNAV